MFMKFPLILCIAAFVMLSSLHANAEDVRELTWDDLIPSDLHFDDPFEKLTDQQLYDLGTVALYRQKKVSKEAFDNPSETYYQEALAQLKADEIDIDGLLAMREEITEKRRARGQTANAELNGQNIRLPGYLLPLEFKEKQVTEFLLVPWVGACIHTPPPPPNQIVHVKMDKGYDIGETLFTPVWVNGVVRTEKNNPELSFVDGTQSIDVSYVMQAEKVEPYEE
jgi:hypothetical protein